MGLSLLSRADRNRKVLAWTQTVHSYRGFAMQLQPMILMRQIWRGLVVCLVAIAFLVSLVRAAVASDAMSMTVYRDPSCRCCGGWMEHVEAQGFQPDNVPTDDMAALKQEYGVPDHLTSCHTAIVGGYLIEGHVPVADIKRLLAEQPQIAGIAVPGMPIGTPGMESDDDVHDAFKVFSFDSQGNAAVFNEYSP